LEVGGQSNAPSALPLGNRPVTHCTGGWVYPRAGLDGCGEFASTRIRSQDRPDRSVVAIPTELSQPTFEYSDLKKEDKYRNVTCQHSSGDVTLRIVSHERFLAALPEMVQMDLFSTRVRCYFRSAANTANCGASVSRGLQRWFPAALLVGDRWLGQRQQWRQCRSWQ
jgi:hypothetical protein